MEDKAIIAARIAALREFLNHHARLYYVLDAPEIPDDVYDAQCGILKKG